MANAIAGRLFFDVCAQATKRREEAWLNLRLQFYVNSRNKSRQRAAPLRLPRENQGLIGILRGQGMYTDYIGSEPRCCVIAKKLIWCVAAICCTGGAVDATGAVARARAMTAPFMSKAQIVQQSRT